MKIALISHKLPPSGAGQAVMIYRMFENLNADSYCLISPESYAEENPRVGNTRKLTGKYYQLPPTWRVKQGHRFGLRYVRDSINLLIAIAQNARRVTEIVSGEGSGAIVACTGDVTHLPAAYLASRRTGIPFHAYVFDHYSHREWYDPVAAFWARRIEPFLMKRAAAVITPNELLRDDLHDRFGVEPVVIHNSLDISSYEANGHQPSSAREGEIKIVYTGEIYDAHYDAFRNLVAALEVLRRPDIKLHIYTSRPAAELKALGIDGPVVHHPEHPATEMPRVQMDADLLFLPLAFDSPYPELVRTSSTTKMGEYLAARRPVLVHAPADSFISWYFRKHDCGVVVDESDPARLVDGIERILDDDGLRERLTANSWTRARADFDVTHSREAFAELIGLNEGQNR